MLHLPRISLHLPPTRPPHPATPTTRHPDGHVDFLIASAEDLTSATPCSVYSKNAAGAYVKDDTTPIASSKPVAFAWGDVDGDGLIDLWVTIDSKPARFFRNSGNGEGLAASAAQLRVEQLRVAQLSVAQLLRVEQLQSSPVSLR